MTKPVNGAFLVRKSTKEPNSFAVSLFFQGKVFHNKVAAHVQLPCPATHVPSTQVITDKGKWIATSNPQAEHASLFALVAYHMKSAGGFQTLLTTPRSRTDSEVLPESGAEVEA